MSAKIDTLTPLQRAFLALEETEARLATVTASAREPIAVIGLGCRVPGGGRDAASFWQLLRDGIDAITPIPADRWNHDALYDPDPATPGHIATRCGGFVDGIDAFDPGFFGIAPREAEGMDPQQRLLLEVSWEALENAGQAPDRLENSATGVFIGAAASDYAYLQLKSGDTGLLDAHFTSGIAHSVVSGRLSFLLGLRGPSLTVDTACSSSLVAVHLACQALRNSECRMALAGGVNLILAPDLFIALSRSRMLSPDGRCKTFDAAADGFARAEGCGMLMLKRLSDARADGDRVLAVISGSAVNQDGPSSSLTAPNGPAQEAVIRSALAFAGLAPRQVGYIEAHGTGTQLGDPQEVKALGAVFGADGRAGRPLRIGSVKTNLGHLEAAAGVTGMIKVVLALQHRTIPPHLHFRVPSPHIAWDELPLEVPVEPVPWETIGGRRVAGISSFGFSGTNAHVIVEEAPEESVVRGTQPDRVSLLAVSARDQATLGELAARHADALSRFSQVPLADIAHTMNTGRTHFMHRATIMARTVEEARAGLQSLAQDSRSSAVRTATVTRRDPLRLAFLFTGQGSQYPNMSKGLYQASPVFRAALDRCAGILAPHLDRPLLDVVFPADAGSALLDQTVYTQPALFAVEYALAELWRSWGVTPNVLIGHSVGEYVAACLAGVFSLEDGLKLIALRGRLMQSLPAGGAMVAVFAPDDVVREAIAPYAARVSIAGINGPAQTTISGAVAHITEICRLLAVRDIQHKALPVSHAFHSPLVEPVLDRFEAAVSAVKLSPPRLRIVSNLTGNTVSAAEITRPAYWRRHMREAVRFADGIRTLEALRVDGCIEIGPAPALLSLASSVFTSPPALMIPSLRRGRQDWNQMLDSVAALYLAGHQVDWRGMNDDGARRLVDLPTYPFQRQRYWFRAAPQATVVSDAHPLLGGAVRSPLQPTAYQSRVSVDAPAFIRQHAVLGRIVMPATAYLEMLIAAGERVRTGPPIVVEGVTIGEAMLLEDDGSARLVHTQLERADDGGYTVSISSVPEATTDAEAWVRHVSARLPVNAQPEPACGALDRLRDACPTPVAIDDFYRGFATRGVNFGPGFRSIEALWRGPSQALGKVTLAAEFAAERNVYRMHPALLDGCIQVTAAGLMGTGAEPTLYLPIGVDSFAWFSAPTTTCWAHVALHPGSGDLRSADLRIFDADGRSVAALRKIQFRRVTRNSLERLDERWLDEASYEVTWRPEPLPAAPGLATAARQRPSWLLFADQGGVTARLAEELRARGDRCTLVRPGQFRFGPDEASIGPAAALEYRQLLERLRAAGRTLTGVVHAWALDSAAWDGMADAQLDQAQTNSALSPTLLAQALVHEDLPPRLWLVTRGGQPTRDGMPGVSPIQAAVWGVGKTLALEHPELGCVCVDLDPASRTGDLDALTTALADDTGENQIAWRSGERHVARLTRVLHVGTTEPIGTAATAWRLAATVPGTLDAFARVAADRPVPGAREVEIAVLATGLNFKDVLNALMMRPGAAAAALGSECAGRVTRVGAEVTHVQVGDEVMAVARECFASFVVTRAELVQRLPNGMDIEAAAGFPIAFITAEFCLSHEAGMRANETVLIHAAAGGVGMAAVQLARRAGAEVFATAGSEAKRALLRAMGVRHVFDSRTPGFADEVLARTGGRGVDIVLNSLAGEMLDASFRAVAAGGRFVEIGQRDIKSPEWVAALGRDIRYAVVDWGVVAASDPALIGEQLARLVDAADRGALTPLPRQVFHIEDASRAFRFMAQARHVGKVVVRHGPAGPATIKRNGTYLVTGGLSGLGLRVAQWLAQHGAGRLVLIGRRGPTDESLPAIERLRNCGTQVVAEAVDVTDEAALSDVLSRIRSDGPPLRGIVHCAGVLDDAALARQDAGRFARVLAPKLRGAWLLDRLTRSDPLDLFVLFSSISGVLGAPGQANHAAANAILDLLAHARRERGLCATSIDWGVWADIGAAAERGLTERLNALGLCAMTPAQGLQALERVLQDGRTQVTVMPIDWPRFRAGAGQPGMALFLGDLGAAVPAPAGAAAIAKSVMRFNLRDELATAPASRRRQVLATFLRDQASRTLGMDSARPIDPTTPLSELGLDSLLVVELRNTLGSTLGQPLPVSLLFDYPTLDLLTDYLLEEVLMAAIPSSAAAPSGRLAAPTAAGEYDAIDLVDDLSDEEVDRLLAARERQNGADLTAAANGERHFP